MKVGEASLTTFTRRNVM